MLNLWGGAKYFVTFIDDASRYTEIVMLRNRSEVIQAFKNYKRKVEKQTGKSIKKIRTDNGKEYLSKEFNAYLEEEGITRQLTVEYTPQQNGVAERANRTIVEMARCMLFEANFPNSLWAEMVNTAVYLRNRSATKSLEGKTPFEAWTQQKPCVKFLTTIGSKTIVLNKRQSHGKFQPKGEEYMLVGYSSESKAYRLWKQGTKTIIKSRDVKFFENIKSSFNAHKEVSLVFGEHFQEEDDSESAAEGVNPENSESEEETEEKAVTKRGRGRPSFVRTGKPGRPRKNYQGYDGQTQDPSSVPEILGRSDKKD